MMRRLENHIEEIVRKNLPSSLRRPYSSSPPPTDPAATGSAPATATAAPATAAPPTAAPPTAGKDFIRHKLVKQIFLRKTLFTNLLQFGIISVSSAVLWWNVCDWYSTPEGQLKKALEELEANDDLVKESGFSVLKRNLFITKRVFSGPVDIPVDASRIVQSQLIQSLINILSSPNTSLSLKAYTWLYHLSTYKPKDKTVRSFIFHADPSLEHITSALTAKDYGKEKNWILASHILLKLRNVEGHINQQVLAQGVEKMMNSKNPLAMSTAVQLYHLVDSVPVERTTAEHLKINSNNELTHIINRVGLESTIDNSQYLFNSSPTKASLESTLFFSAFAAVWGKLRWLIATSTSNEFNAMAKSDPEQAKQVKKIFLKKRTVGRSVFALLFFDFISSQLLQKTTGDSLSFSSDSIVQLPKELKNYNLPMSSLLPLAQTTTFMLGALYLLKYQRYVVLPLVLAGSYYNRDLLYLDPLVNYYKTSIASSVSQ